MPRAVCENQSSRQVAQHRTCDVADGGGGRWDAVVKEVGRWMTVVIKDGERGERERERERRET